MNEKFMNQYFNMGKYNHPVNIGYVMNSIRQCKPLTITEWEIFYFENVRTFEHIESLVRSMHNDIPKNYRVSYEECLDYFLDVLIRRTFEGYNKENQALKILRSEISDLVNESPKEWDGEYFIDFYVYGRDGKLIGIQLKPETFYYGGYNRIVNIDQKLKSFREEFNALTFTIRYRKADDNNIIFVNSEILDEIRIQLENEG